jgi:hypothetical protein
MRRHLAALLVAGALHASPALAAGCVSPDDQATFDVAALKSDLMVLATDCNNDSDYNAVINRFRAELLSNDSELGRYFERVYGPAAQREHDAYITSLANAQADQGIKLGSDFCPRDNALFSEVMALPDSKDLAPYAAGKALVPASLGACVEPLKQGPRMLTKKRRKHA